MRLRMCMWCGGVVDISTHSTPSGATVGGVPEDALSRPLSAVLATARRRAARGGDRTADTAHLLHGLLESDPAVRESLGGGWPLTAKLLGYLAQRCIGYGQRWRHTVEQARGPYAAVGAPEAPHGPGGSSADGPANARMSSAGSSPAGSSLAGSSTIGSSGAGWSPAATAALTAAVERAAARGARSAEGVDLFAALAADPECRAAEVLRTAGVDVRALTAVMGVQPPSAPPEPSAPHGPSAPWRGVRGIRGDTPVAGLS
jgi:hypothetical protein